MRLTTALTITTLSLAALGACSKKDEAAKAPAPAAQSAADAATSAVASSGGMPVRKPGLWEHTVSTAGATQTTRLCLDAATDAQLSIMGSQAGKDICSDQHMSRGLDGSYSFRSVCDLGEGGKMTSTGTIKGDFNSSYVVESTSSTAGAAMPQMNGAHSMRLTAVWKGPCPAGFVPGDMELPGGQKMNLAQMGAVMGGVKK